jgi:membrane protein
VDDVLRRALAFLKSASREFAVVNPARHAAALAYFGMFSLIPILAIGYQLAYRLLSDQARGVLAEFRAQLAALLGEAVVTTLHEQVTATASRTQAGSWVVTLTSIFIILFTASGAFTQLKYSLNTIWGIPYETQLRTRPMILARLMGMAIVIGIGFLLVLAVGAYLLVSAVSGWLGLGGIVPVLNALAIILLLALSFAALYRILPDARVSWRGACVGALLAAVVSMLGLVVAAIYFRYFRLNTALGVAGGLALILIGINYLAQIFLFGAVVSKTLDVPARTEAVPHG